MFIVYRCKDADGKSLYDANSIIGIYVDMVDAKTDLQAKLNELKYEYEYLVDEKEYCFIGILKKNGKKMISSPMHCFEIINKSLTINKIKLR